MKSFFIRLKSSVKHGNRIKPEQSSWVSIWKDLIFLITALALFAVTLIGIALGKTEFYYYPEITEIQADAGFIITCSAYFALAILPFITEIKEELKWKYCISKI
mgnify:CR=1 FL=1